MDACSTRGQELGQHFEQQLIVPAGRVLGQLTHLTRCRGYRYGTMLCGCLDGEYAGHVRLLGSLDLVFCYSCAVSSVLRAHNYHTGHCR